MSQTPTPPSGEPDEAAAAEADLQQQADRTMYLKYIAEDAATFADVAKALRDTAMYLDELTLRGFELTQPVDGGHMCWDKKPGGAVQ